MARLAAGGIDVKTTPVDAGFAAVLALAAALEVGLSDYGAPFGAAVVAVMLPTVPLAWRTTAPVASVAATTFGWSLAVVLGFPTDEPVIPSLAPVVAIYSLGAQAVGWRLGAGAALALAAYGGGALADPGALGALLFVLPGAALALGAGIAVRLMGFETESLETRAALLEIERDEAADAAIATERARIARELHDVIGHSISVMGVQAGAVRRRLAADQEQEREMLLAVERVGRDAVAEMRRLLGFLRTDDDDATAAPVPTLARVADLVGDMRLAGLSVELHIDDEAMDLSPGRALVVFRVLQEGLTNVLRHAPGAHATSIVRRATGGIEIVVVNDAGTAPAPSAPDGGHGLLGLRERVTLYGGALHAEPRPEGGFALHAFLPAASPP